MNLSSIPDSIQKRDILYGVHKVSADEMRRIASTLETAGQYSDAVDFLTQAQDQTGLTRIQALAVNEGDVFLFLKCARSLGLGEGPEAQLLACTDKAESLGKTRYAIRGFEKLGRQADVTRLRDNVKVDGDIVIEETVFIPESEEPLESKGEV